VEGSGQGNTGSQGQSIMLCPGPLQFVFPGLL
jgi:hypothetical protein